MPSHTGWVQFAYQADPGDLGPLSNIFGWNVTSALCVWNVDINVANATNNNNGYFNTCIGVPSPYWNMWEGPIPIQIMGSETNQILSTEGCFPWAGCFSVQTPDVFGLCWNPTSAQCAWQQVSGTLLGFGGGSTATFSAGTTMYTTVGATACSPLPGYTFMIHPFPPLAMGSTSPTTLAALQCPPALPFPAVDSNGGPLSTSVTGEANNLSAPSPYIQACVEGTCWITYPASN